MKGFFNRVLFVDLSNRSYRYEELNDTVLEQSLGGKGLGVHLMMEHNPAGKDPLKPENLFVIATGPATGTNMWGQNRFGVYTRSPATGGWGESYCGGTLAPKIKGCGVDAVVLSGCADELCYLCIDEQGVSFERAADIRQAETDKSEAYILERAPHGAGALVIGPAGENLAAMACIKSDRWRSLGRGGFGAVLGSKRIKGLAFSGSLKADIADADLLKSLIKEISRMAKDSPVTEVYRSLGTPSMVRVTNSNECFPTRYWHSGVHPHWEKLSGEYMREKFNPESRACPPCLLRCTKFSTVSSGPHAGLKLEGPEYETIYALGGLNELDSLEEVAFLNDLCDRLGLDTMSAGNLAGLATEAYKRGKSDFQIDYNQPRRMAELFHLISAREGVGSVLAKGIIQAAVELGVEDIAVHAKGLEPAGFDPRVLKGMGLSYATAARGACHLRGTFYKPELSGEIDRAQINDKAPLFIDYEDRAALFDCMILCRFYRDFIKWDELARLIEATTGLTFSKEQLQQRANEITQNTRRFNTREGLDSSADCLSTRLLDRPNAQGATLTAQELNSLLTEYNRIRGAI